MNTFLKNILKKLEEEQMQDKKQLEICLSLEYPLRQAIIARGKLIAHLRMNEEKI